MKDFVKDIIDTDEVKEEKSKNLSSAELKLEKVLYKKKGWDTQNGVGVIKPY